MRPAGVARAELRVGLLQQKRAKGGIEPIKGLIRQPPDPPQRMTGRDPLLDRNVGEQGAAALPVTSHLGSGSSCHIFAEEWLLSKLLGVHLPIQPSTNSSARWTWRLSAPRSAIERWPKSLAEQAISAS